MYAYLEGKFSYKSPAQLYLDVNGIGFEVNISLNTYSAIQGLQSGKLFTHLQVKEDGHTLFGFFEKEEKEIVSTFIIPEKMDKNSESLFAPFSVILISSFCVL